MLELVTAVGIGQKNDQVLAAVLQTFAEFLGRGPSSQGELWTWIEYARAFGIEQMRNVIYGTAEAAAYRASLAPPPPVLPPPPLRSWKALARQTDGRTLAAGQFGGGPGSRADFVLGRFLADGSPDPGFGEEGIVRIDASQVDYDDGAEALVAYQDAGGRWLYVVAGYSYGYGTRRDFVLLRVKEDGTLDATFGANGIVNFDVSRGAFDDSAQALVTYVDTAGNRFFVAAGYTFGYGTNRDVALLRITGNGALDTTFGEGGFTHTDLSRGGFEDAAQALVAYADAGGNLRFVIAGYTYGYGTGQDFALSRYLGNGKVDVTFGDGGIVHNDVSICGYPDAARALLTYRDSQGKRLFVAAGYTTGYGTREDFAVVRFQEGGALDASFGTDGIVHDDLSESANDDGAHSLTTYVDSRGRRRFVAAGHTYGYHTNSDFALARYDDNGSRDITFEDFGHFHRDTSKRAIDDAAYAVLAYQDGEGQWRYLAAGYAYLSGAWTRLATHSVLGGL